MYNRRTKQGSSGPFNLVNKLRGLNRCGRRRRKRHKNKYLGYQGAKKNIPRLYGFFPRCAEAFMNAAFVFSIQVGLHNVTDFGQQYFNKSSLNQVFKNYSYENYNV
jgi:hypothetical protein